MDESAKQFDKTFKHLGGLVDSDFADNFIFTNAIKNARIIIDSLRKGNPKLPDVYINYIDNTTLNACVTKSNSNYFIGINHGTVLLLLNLFFRMLSNPKTLPKYGDVSKEINRRKIYNAQFTDFRDLANALSPSQLIAPVDNTRYDLALLLTYKAIKFLIMHEYAHIIKGHLGYCINITKDVSLMERNVFDNEQKELDPLFSQTFEMDADGFAITMIIKELDLLSKNRIRINEEFKLFYNDTDEILSLWIFSIYSFWRLFGMKDYAISDLKKYSHPPPGIRQLQILSVMQNVHNSIKANKDDRCLKAAIDVELAFENISKQEFNMASFFFSYQKEAIEHYDFLVENSDNVRILLEPYAYQQ